MTKCDDPIECGHEAALGQWEARWEALMKPLEAVEAHPALVEYIREIERQIPTGLPVGKKYITRMAGHITIQLKPEMVSRLVEVLRSAGAHPSGLGSYPAANDANALADDIVNMAARQ